MTFCDRAKPVESPGEYRSGLYCLLLDCYWQKKWRNARKRKESSRN